MTETFDRQAGAGAICPDLDGKVAVVTGGSRGIGAATARALAANGVEVAVVGRDRAAVDAVAADIRDLGGKAIAIAADCTVDDDLHRLRAEVHADLGRVDILATFAGGNGQPVPTTTETAEHWRRVLDGDLTATFLTISAFLDDLTAGGGSIVTMASSAAREPTDANAAYAAAKSGVMGLTRHLAGELAPHGVRVNCLSPATIETERMRAYTSDEVRARLAAGFPLGRLGQPQDVAAAALFFASGASSWITGVTLDVAGGHIV
ncbi:SDR family oxidoreductase [Planctomonas sp. JC2975]|uniref:SDR family NAD(P)-dependent oxidoreductase n=1 Tax=Planctomonas sp. JC2975 TaxID=2729626 RepID=UPI0014736D60|nr:SDR family oxidoreductase [Planctomonas sp. JC2975]NNC12912.1 SDR family oxidoreductase [Planctomonas sp. JC2975]